MPIPPCGDGTNRGEVPAPPSILTPATPPLITCIDTDATILSIGGDTYYIFTDNGFFLLHPACDPLEVDCLLIGQGGLTASQGEDSLFMVNEDGVVVEDVEEALRALGGGQAGPASGNGGSGGSGGGGGAQSPSATGSSTAGGGTPDAEQGSPGGAGFGRLGLLADIRAAASGGGGGFGSPGTQGQVGPGTLFWAIAGEPGVGGLIPGWPLMYVSPGEGGRAEGNNEGEPISLRGGAGGGGVKTFSLITIQPGSLVSAIVGGAELGKLHEKPFGSGGGTPGLVALRVKGTPPVGDDAVLSGGTVIEKLGFRYHIFSADGVLEVITAGVMEFLVVGPGGAGGSGVGGGGGAGEVLLGSLFVEEEEEAQVISVGQGGDGVVGGSGGPGSAPTGLGELIEARPGGGGVATGADFTDGDGASSGGGRPNGRPGRPELLRGNPGGHGRSFESGVDTIGYAGGGGGVAEPGQEGATEEGLDLSEEWAGVFGEGSHQWHIDFGERLLRITASNGIRYLRKKDVARSELFLQSRQKWDAAGDGCRPGLIAKMDAVDARGYIFKLAHVSLDQAGIYSADTIGSASGGTLVQGASGSLSALAGTGEFASAQFYVADGVQVAWAGGIIDGVFTEITASAADTTHNGREGTYGPSIFPPFDTTPRPAWWEYVDAFASRYLMIDGVPTGWKAQIRNLVDEVVVEGTESVGEIELNCQRPNAFEDVPEAGWPRLVLLDDLDVEQAELLEGIVPGGTYEFSGGELVSTIPDEPRPGRIERHNFNEFVPGPEQGNGGSGFALSDDFLFIRDGWKDTDFDEYSVNEAPPGDWNPAMNSLPNGTDWRIDAFASTSWPDPGDSGKLLTQLGSSGSSDPRGLLWTVPGDIPGDIEVEMEFRVGSGTLQRPGILIHYQDEDNFYQLRWARSQQSLRLFKRVAGASALLVAVDTIPLSSGVTYRVKIQRVGDRLNATVWPASEEPPTSWLISVVDTDLLSGFVGLLNITDVTHFNVFEVSVPTTIIPSDDGFIAAGGGAASEASIAGRGGKGGGGDGTNVDATPGVAATVVGSGGGGARDVGQPGGAGANGIVVIRTKV